MYAKVEETVLEGGIVRANGLVFDITRKRLSDDDAEKTRWKEKVSFGGFVWTEGDERKRRKGEEWEGRPVYQLAAQGTALAWAPSNQSK